MSNNSYLVFVDEPSLYPSSQVATFSPEADGVAFDVYAIPLLWLALFRPGDIVEQSIHVDADPDAVVTVWDPVTGERREEAEQDEDFDVSAPLVDISIALAQLAAATPRLSHLFDTDLQPHAVLLAQAIESGERKFITIELDEIEALWEPDTFWPTLTAALASFDVPGDDAQDRQRFVELSSLRAAPIPAADVLFGSIEPPADEQWNFARALGVGFIRPVPWEPTYPDQD